MSDSFRNKHINNPNIKVYGYLYHLLHAIMILILLISIFTINLKVNRIEYAIYFISTYTIMRFGIFDIIYNIINGKPIQYVGETALIDRIIKDKADKATYITVIRVFCFILSIILIMESKSILNYYF